MLKLKYLSLCLLGVALSGCSSHVIKSTSIHQDADKVQRLIDGTNAIYEYPEFDYRGTMSIHLLSNEAPTQVKKDQPKLNHALQKKLDQYLKQQKIQLDTKQKNTVFNSIIEFQNGLTDQSQEDQVYRQVKNIFKNLEFNYDGTVNYRQQMATFNLAAQYQKDNLFIHARIPSVLDFKNFRFYTNVNAVLPFLTDPSQGNRFSYFDFSQFSPLASDIDKKSLVEFLKEVSAVSYLLTPQHQLKRIPLNAEEVKQGGVEKIRIHANAEEWMLHSDLFIAVNRNYLVSSIFKIDEAKVAKISGAELQSGESKSAEQEVVEAANQAIKEINTHPEVVAEQAMLSLYEAVNNRFNKESEDLNSEQVIEAEALDSSASATERHAYETTVQSEDEEYTLALEALSEEQCAALTESKQKAKVGDIEYCKQFYGVDLITPKTNHQNKDIKKVQAELEQIFSVYNNGNFINAEHFKQLWTTHLSEINQALGESQHRSPIVIDVILDAQGRAIDFDYDIQMSAEEIHPSAKFKMNLSMELLNYGQAAKIDRKQLQQAQPFTEAFKNSPLAQLLNPSKKVNSEDDPSMSWDEQLSHLAEQVYTSTGSYEKTYKAVFIAQLTAAQPELVQYYSAQDLQEIAAVYAYRFSDEERYSLAGAGLQQNEALQKKHHLMLEAENVFDEALGHAVDEIVSNVMDAHQPQFDIQQLKRKYQSTATVFSEYYQTQFKLTHDLTDDEIDLTVMNKTADILGQAYVALNQQKFDEAVIQHLDQDALIYIDYNLFKQIYLAISQANSK